MGDDDKGSGRWHRGTSEQARAYLQTRLIALSKLMFWAFIALLTYLFAMYETYPEIRPHSQDVIYSVSAGAVVILAVLWRGVLTRRSLPLEALYGIDLFYMFGTGCTLGAAAFLAWDLEASSYTCLLYGSFTVFTRALVVPSTGARTALASCAMFVPLAIAAGGLAWSTDRELPDLAFVTGAVMLSAVAVLLATVGSRVIYGLRRQVTDAMQLGQYTLDEKIGEGGMGVVYRAHHVLLRRPTAIKLLLPDRIGAENLARFEREVQHMSQLTHPNTVAVYDYGRSPEGLLYYAMEYLGGGVDLEDLVETYGPQPSGRVAHIMTQVCGALNEAHELGFVHRDIKPANIILCERGGMPDVAKVVDFGLVKEITPDASATNQVVLGTPAYVAPEAVTDPETVGPAVDLYALGAVGYFLVTGRRVFEGRTAVEVCIQHVTRAPTPPSTVTPLPIAPELEAIILRCLEKEPSDRYASATELAEALGSVPGSAAWRGTAARQWWSAHQSGEAGTSMGGGSSASPVTITIDLQQRAKQRAKAS